MAETNGETTSGATAARVTRTGIALVHEGELILPAAGSAAQAEQVLDDANRTIHFYFPVEIEVRAGGREPDMNALIQETLRQLRLALQGI